MRLLFALLLLLPGGAAVTGCDATDASCCRVCTTGVACGDSCIPEGNSCNQGPGCACNG